MHYERETASELNIARSSAGTAQNVAGHFEQDRSMYVYQQLGSTYADWTIVKQIPNETLYARATTLTWNNAMIAIAALVLVIVATLFISIRITGPLKQLMWYMNQNNSGVCMWISIYPAEMNLGCSLVISEI